MDLNAVTVGLTALASAGAGLLGGIYQGRAALAKARTDREAAIDTRTTLLLDRLQKSVDDCQKDRDLLVSLRVDHAVLTERAAGLQKQIDHLSLAGMSTGVPVVEVRADKNGIVIDVSDGITALLGYRVASVVGKPLHSLLPKDFREQHRVAYDRANANQAPGRAQWRPVNGDALHADGSRVPVVVVVQQIADGYRGYICPLTPQLPV